MGEAAVGCDFQGVEVTAGEFGAVEVGADEGFARLSQGCRVGWIIGQLVDGGGEGIGILWRNGDAGTGLHEQVARLTFDAQDDRAAQAIASNILEGITLRKRSLRRSRIRLAPVAVQMAGMSFLGR